MSVHPETESFRLELSGFSGQRSAELFEFLIIPLKAERWSLMA
jgi:hypothetical protein